MCSELHCEARDAFLLWRTNGKPRAGPMHVLMKSTRAMFKLALRQSRIDTTKKDADSLAHKLLSKDQKQFWNEIKKINSKEDYNAVANIVDGVSGSKAITEKCRCYFKDLLDSKCRSTNDHLTSYNRDSDCSIDSNVSITSQEIHETIKKLKLGKAPGYDHISSEHLKYAHNKVSVILSIIFNTMIVHGFVPLSFMDTLVIPLVKDRKEDIGSSGNYRPIALTNVVSKVFESVILDKYKPLLETTPNQFGFKPKHGTELAVFTLKQVVEFYRSNSSTMYVCYIDLSKAFDRVDHLKLFEKLKFRNMPLVIIRLLQYWYKFQKFFVRWSSCVSEPFCVSNGVRQGGILSPAFFNVFVDELSVCLRSVSVGCYIGETCMNHIIYADDTALLAPSPAALQKLIDIAAGFINERELVVNMKKTKCMTIKPKCDKVLHVPTFYMNGNAIKTTCKESYLGVDITDDFKDDSSIAKQARGMYARGNMMNSRFGNCTEDVKKQLFLSYCESFYCAALWDNFTHTALTQLHVAHNSIFRLLFRLPTRGTTYNFLVRSIPNFLETRRKLVYGLYKRTRDSENILIQSIVKSNFFMGTEMFKKWKSILF